jgi:hypothetical protein
VDFPALRQSTTRSGLGPRPTVPPDAGCARRLDRLVQRSRAASRSVDAPVSRIERASRGPRCHVILRDGAAQHADARRGEVGDAAGRPGDAVVLDSLAVRLAAVLPRGPKPPSNSAAPSCEGASSCLACR